ncbi:MAG: ATP-dependent RecD-like DNA helicase [Candidatus Aminicenantes bacterium]|nr:MAG: ATP-dependent RecD-like DNA helicase [Candidatus Aminicenantes bacterium]
MKTVTQFKVKVLKKIFFSEETGFSVCRVSIQGKRENTTMVGNLFDVNEGDFLQVEGEFVTHPKFGKQIKVHSFQSILPQDRDGIVKYLSSGRIKGIGKKSAEKIVNRFGTETFEILEKYPQRLREIKGIPKKVIDEVQKNTADNKIIRQLTVKLAPYGIGQETIFKIFKEFQEDSFNILEQNPYVLIDRVRGVGFRIADTIARSFGIANNDSYRIKAGILFWLSQYEQKNGDIYIEEAELIMRAAALLDVDEQHIAKNINEMIGRNQLVREELPGIDKVIVTYRNYVIEEMIAKYLDNLSSSGSHLPPIEVNFNYIFERTSVELTQEQKQAVISAVNNRITIITGGPGTGKTTIIKALIESLEKDSKNVLIAAPTGRAAKRVEEATQYPASTIHRMLKIDPETWRFVHNEQNPLPADAIIIDEFSMVDFYIFHSLLKAISQNTRLIIIGDKDQLPSVGPGNVLRDIIGSGYFNIIYLSRNFRQTADSLIIENAYRINSGDNLVIKPYSRDLDFVFIKVNSERQALEKVLRIIEYYKIDYPFNSSEFQVLVPMYRGEAGIDNVNLQTQETFNNEPPLVKKEKMIFKRWDKVMQLKNNYEKDIFNGEQGMVVDFNREKKAMIVDFDGSYLEYAIDEWEELTLSYAVSVHKAQGSEYDMLILVLLPTHAIMLNRELFYTAVTRAKKKIFLISDPGTVRRAIANASPSKRKTLLPQRLRDIFEHGKNRNYSFL